MKFFAVASLFALAASAIATPIIDTIEERAPNNAKKVLNYLTTTGQDIVKLNGTLNGIPNSGNPSFIQLVAVKNQSQKIGYDLGNTTALAKASSPWTAPQSKAIANKVKALEPSIFQLLDNFGRHKPAFTNAGAAGQVKTGLIQQRDQTKAQGTAFQAKLTQPYKGQAPKVTAAIVARFNKIIKIYS